jgi:protein O-GlcNAc transferase
MSTTLKVLEQGLSHHQAGKLQEAATLYQQVLQTNPNHPEALHLLGVLQFQMGNLEAAIPGLRQAIQNDPQKPEYYNSLGEVLRSTGDIQAALNCYHQAIQVQPTYAEAHYNLGNLLQTLGQHESAITCYQNAIALKSTLAQAHHNLGFLLKQTGQPAAAIAAYRTALALQPDYGLALNNLGVALQEADDLPGAIVVLQQAIHLQANYADAHYNLGNTFKLQGNVVAAMQSYQNALKFKPNWAEAYYGIGNFCKDQGQSQEALTYYQQALNLKPDYPEALWNQKLTLPILYDQPEQIQAWRDRLIQGLDDLEQVTSLDTARSRQQALAGVSHCTNFYLQYQGCDDLELQRRYGALVHRIMAANYPQWTRSIQRKVLDRKIRVGMISQFFREHTIGKLFLGWFKFLNPDQFELYCYYLGKHQDWMTAEFQTVSQHFYHGYDCFEQTCQRLERDRLDILIFTDIGMNPESYKLAALRFATVQCATWGHPITSGLPTIDYYLSSGEMEPQTAQTHYSEHLICLPKISIAYEPPALPTVRLKRDFFQLRPEAVVYLSCQSLYKYLPQYDLLFPKIAQQVAGAQFVFLASPTKGDEITLRFQARLKSAFADYGLDSQHYCVFLPRLSWQEYLNVNLVSDIFLDTLSWSGGNTTLEAIACGLPIVTCPGEFMRGRHAYAMLKTLGVTETIATSETEYVEIAVRLGLDPVWRGTIVDTMQTAQPQLYTDQKCIQALESFLKQVSLGKS